MDELFLEGFSLGRSLKKCLFSLSVAIFGLLLIPWQFRYPILGHVVQRPGSMTIKSPKTGLISQLEVEEGDVVNQGQTLLEVDVDQGLMYQSYYQKKLHHIVKKLKQQTQERTYQLERLEKLEPLVKRHMLSRDTYHELESNFRLIDMQRQESLGKLMVLRRQQEIRLQAPFSGRIVDLNVGLGEAVLKAQRLFSIQPLEQKWLFKFKLPIEVLSQVHLGSSLRLSLQDASKLKSYSIKAQVIHIEQSVHGHQGQSHVLVMAKILNPLEGFLVKMPLDGYVIGSSQSWISWFIQWIFKN